MARKSCARCGAGYPGYANRTSWSISPAVTARPPPGRTIFPSKNLFPQIVNSPTKPAIVSWIIAVTFISTLRVRNRFPRNPDFEAVTSNMENADARTVGDGHISDVDGGSGGGRTNRWFSGQGRTIACACRSPPAAGRPGATGQG